MNLIFAGHSCSHYRQRRLGEACAEQGVKTIVVGPEQWGDEHYESYKKKNFIFRTCQTGGPQSFYMFTFKEMNRIISAFRPAVIYCMEEPFTLFARECVRYAQEFHCPLSIFTWENRLDFRLNEPLDRIEQEVIRSADKIICGNQLAKKRMISCGADPNKLHVLPQTGLDLELFKPVEEINNVYDLCYHGRMVREKGLPFLESVAKELKLSLLWIGGRGEYHPQWGDIRDWTKYEDLPGFINSTRIEVQVPFSYNGYSEQMNYSTGEAMLMELPVICSDNGSIPENYTGSPAKIIPQGDPDALKATIQELINDEEKRNKMGKKGREWASKNLSLKVIGKKLLDILELN